MSESFRERVKSNVQLMNQLITYEKQHELEWCPVSDDMLKAMYPGQCDTQEARDAKVDSMINEEFRQLLDAVLKRYRMLKRKKEKRDRGESEEEEAGEEGEAERQTAAEVEQYITAEARND
jgi:hypothetical protein